MFQWSFALVSSILISASAYAHEFWISPVNYEVTPDEPIEAHFRVGQGFDGGSHSFLSRYATRHGVVHLDQNIDISARNGDRPAFQHPGLPNGLAVLVHETTDSTLTYREYEKFLAFVEHKDFAGQPEAHVARGLPEVGFVESYRRFAKSLVSVGNGAGQDEPVGLDIEIVALANPYTDNLSNGMQVHVLMAGQPRADVQVEVFQRATATKDAAQITLYRTDTDGIATFPVAAGQEYMVDNVALIPVKPEVEGNPVWRSLWASLTFSVPAN